MINTIARLDELLDRASKLTDKQAKEAAQLLLPLCSDSKNCAKAADYLMKFKPAFCLAFFEAAAKTLDHETQLKPLFSAMRSTQAYRKNVNHAATSRGFIAAAVLIKNGAGIARETLMLTIADVEKDGKFSEAVIKHFEKHVLDYCGSFEMIKALGGESWNDKDKADQSRFMRFINAVEGKKVETDARAEVRTEVHIDARADDREEVHTDARADVREEISDDDRTDARPEARADAHAALGLTAEIITNLSRASKEAAILTQQLSDTNGTLALLRNAIETKDARIAELLSAIGDKERALIDLDTALNQHKLTLREKEESMADLSQRLKNSLQMDAISQGQELITLKTNLQNSLKVEYSDYLALKEEACNADTYGALIGSLARIFRVLRRLGITIG